MAETFALLLTYILNLPLIILNVKIKRIWPNAKIKKWIKILWILGQYNSRHVFKHVTLHCKYSLNFLIFMNDRICYMSKKCITMQNAPNWLNNNLQGSFETSKIKDVKVTMLNAVLNTSNLSTWRRTYLVGTTPVSNVVSILVTIIFSTLAGNMSKILVIYFYY